MTPLKNQNIKLLKSSQGLSLLELMIAVTIFAIITIAVFTLYNNTQRNYTIDERTARMLENGRYALSLIARDMSMADFYGTMMDTIGIEDGSMTNGADCDTQLLTTKTAILYYETGGTPMSVHDQNDVAGATASDFDPITDTTCDGSAQTAGGDILAGTNILAIKRTANQPDATPDTGNVYINTNGSSATFAEFNGGNPAFEYWQYTPVMYFIRDDVDDNGNPVPALCRLELKDAETLPTPRVVGDPVEFEPAPADCLAEGIEHIHVEFGLNTDADQVADYYKSNITTAEANEVVSARIYLLVRADMEAQDYVNQKVYNMGTFTVNGGAPYGDGYYRRVFVTTVVLRNTRAQGSFN